MSERSICYVLNRPWPMVIHLPKLVNTGSQVVFYCRFIVLNSLVVKQKIYICYSITFYQLGYLLIFKTGCQHKSKTCDHLTHWEMGNQNKE